MDPRDIAENTIYDLALRGLENTCEDDTMLLAS